MSNGCCNRIKSCSTVLLWDGDSEETKFTKSSKLFNVEHFLFIVFMGLWFYVFECKIANHFAQHLMLFARVC